MASLPGLGRWLPPAFTPVPAASLVRAVQALLPGGDRSDELRRLLTERYGTDRVILTDSGTNALQLALQTVASSPVRNRARVALPAFACFDLVTATVGAGIDPVFYDVTPETLEPEWGSFEDAVTDKVRAVVIAPLFGLSGGWRRASELADAAGVSLIEDAAQGFGSTPCGQRAGTLGAASVLSFGRGKGWTGGGGGALLLRSVGAGAPEPCDNGSSAFGVLLRSVAQWLFGHPSRYGIPASIPALHLGETQYHPPRPPCRMSRASIAMAVASLLAATAEAERRRHTARELIEAINGGTTRWCADAGYLRMPVLMPDAETADEFAKQHRKLGVERSYPVPLPRLDAVGPAGQPEDAFPGAGALASRLITLPTHSHLRKTELQFLAARVRESRGIVVGPPAQS